jgi:hypothetical protein
MLCMNGQEMSVLAWLGEAIRPGPVGKIQFGKPPKKSRSRMVVLVRFVVSLAVLLIALRYLLLDQSNHWGTDSLSFLAIALVYLVLGYFVHPKAEPRNLGWLGGLFDNPFRLSDDVNRGLILLELLLLPGRFISSSFVEFTILLVNANWAAPPSQ